MGETDEPDLIHDTSPDEREFQVIVILKLLLCGFARPNDKTTFSTYIFLTSACNLDSAKHSTFRERKTKNIHQKTQR